MKCVLLPFAQGNNAKGSLRPGIVCALDPMVWCEGDHDYIRVEDTIVITRDGCERLTGAAPFEVDEVEALVATSRGPFRFGGV